MDFRVTLDVFRGPLDLLLYLVRKHEVEIVDLPIAPITDQFLAYLAVLEQLDVNAAGDFLEMASTLIEIKSRLVLPRSGELDDEMPDPRHELVERLLEYKKYRDAASMLEEQGRNWQQRMPRLADDRPPRERNLGEEEIREVELWDLVGALGRILRDVDTTPSAKIVYDETPIHVYITQIKTQLQESPRVAFGKLFRPGMNKSAVVGMFLAILELVRHQHAAPSKTTCSAKSGSWPRPIRRRDRSRADRQLSARRLTNGRGAAMGRGIRPIFQAFASAGE